MTHAKQLYIKRRHCKRYWSKLAHKETDRLRCANYQRKLDLIAKDMKRKGNGRVHKIKGQTMPTMLCANSRCSKRWKHLNGKPMRGESMKVAIIWDLT